MAIPNNSGVRRIVNALRFSVAGFRACLKEEAFRQELMLAAFLVPFGLWLGDTPGEKCLLASSVMFVLIIELLNSAIERAIDRISADHHILSKEAKDMGSAAVLISVLVALVIWIFIGIPRLLF